MTRDIINAPDLDALIGEQLARANTVLAPHLPALRAAFRRALPLHPAVRRARRLRGDPAWAQAKFDAGLPLFRLVRDREVETDLRAVVRELEDLVQARAGDAEVAKVLRGLPHFNGDPDALLDLAMTAGERSARRRLRALRHRPLHSPRRIVRGDASAELCATMGEVIALGREARNCLAGNLAVQRRIVTARAAIWAFRHGGLLLAVVEAGADGRVSRVRGPQNAPVGAADLQDFSSLLAEAGLVVVDGAPGLPPPAQG